jgi:hypothetical protein
MDLRPRLIRADPAMGSVSGSVIVAWWRLHAVCVKTRRPVREAPVKKSALILAKMMPCMVTPAPTSTWPATCQKMLSVALQAAETKRTTEAASGEIEHHT